MAEEQKINIPDLPAPTPDFNSFITDVTTGDISPRELDYRLRAQGGFARDENNKYVEKFGSSLYAGYSSVNADVVRESRSVTSEQREVIKTVSGKVEAFRQVATALNNTASFLEDVLANKFSPQELDYRLRARAGFARDEAGKYIEKFGGSLYAGYGSAGTDALREDRTVTPEQARLIKTVSAKVEVFKKTKVGLGDVASFLEDVLANKFSPQELDYRLRARAGFARDEAGKYIEKFGGSLYAGYGSAGTDALREDRTVTPEQARLIRKVSESAQSRAASLRSADGEGLARQVLLEAGSIEEIRAKAAQIGMDVPMQNDLQALLTLKGQISEAETDSLLLRYLENGNDEPLFDLLESRGIQLADISDAGNVRAEAGYLRDYVQTARRIKLRSRFWKDMQDTLDPNDSFRILEEYETYDEEDRRITLELREEGLRVRRDAFITQAFKQLSTDAPDYTTAAVYLTAVGTIASQLQDKNTLELLGGVVDLAYQSEIDLIFGSLIKELSLDRAKIAEVREKLKDVPIRPAVAGVDFFQKFQAASQDFQDITRALDAFALEREIAFLQERFLNDPDVTGLVQEVFDLPGETAEDNALKQHLLDELALLVTIQKGLNPSRFNQLKELSIDGIRAGRVAASETIDLAATPERRNLAAVSNLVNRFKNSIMPLFEAIRGGIDGPRMAESYVASGDEYSPRDLYVQRIAALREQRDLTDSELAYLESVELLSIFNPHLVALAREHPELTSLYLESYFGKLDAMTKEKLIDGMYVPTIQIGLGPNGLAAAGEVNRSNPDLAKQVLYIDAQVMPGGPFAVAKGLSWELNSANSLGRTTNVLPDLTTAEEAGIAVRSYGSPLVTYPGERKEGLDTRQGSINVTADYLLNPDNVSTKRYPTNVDLARVLQLQAAMLVDNLLLGTEVTSVRPAEDSLPGNKIVEIAFATPQGEAAVLSVRTDAIIVSSGLGKPNYGIELEGSDAQKILEGDNLGDDEFPRLTDTIGAFEALSNPEGEAVAPEGVIAIYGGGNSADVLIEYLGRQFESGNPFLNGINKVYVVTNAPLSQRPRYAQINDLKSRNGQPNFLELVQSRVRDIRDNEGKLELLDENGQPIIVGSNGGSKVLAADHVIAASGFRPMLDEVFGPLLAEGESLDRRAGLDRVSLPNNPGFSIADALVNDPDVVIVGTGSRPDFKNPNKLAQLPEEAREALLRNGAENAVAIGFRTPDTRAAVRLKFATRTFANRSELQVESRRQTIDINEVTDETVQISVPILPVQETPLPRRDVEADSETLTALLLGQLPKLTLIEAGQDLSPTSSQANTGFGFTVTLNDDQKAFIIKARQATPTGLSSVLQKALGSGYFQAYALKALSSRRSNKGLEILLSFSSGKLRLRDPGPEAEDQRRTYVEAL